MLELDATILSEIVMMERVRVHGVLGLVSLGADFLTVYFRWEPACVDGKVVLRKTPTLVMERPAISVISPTGAFGSALQQQGGSRPNGVVLHS